MTGVPGSGPDYNVWHFQDATDFVTLAAANAFITDLTAFYNAIKSSYPTGTVITVGSSVETVLTPVVIVAATPQIVTAPVGNAQAAPQPCLVATWRTVFGGRSYRGRTYIGPLQASAINAGTPPTTYVTQLQTAASALVTASNTATSYDLVVYSKKLAQANKVIQGVARGYYGTQRRRV